MNRAPVDPLAAPPEPTLETEETPMPRAKTIITALVVTAIAVAIIWRIPQVKKLVTGE